MDLPDSIAIKLNAYTLFCHQLLTHLPALNDATRTDPRLTTDDCLTRFDQSLHQFFNEAAPRDLEQAVNELGAALQGRVALFRAQNPQAAAVFDQVIEAARAAIPIWRYQEDLEALHQQGRQLARHFYAKSPRPVTQARLSQEARLLFCDDEEPVVSQEEAFSYHPTPVAFRKHYLDEETDQELTDVLLVRFGFDRDSALYLAYPYLFMHEYVAHTFALDYGNERFNDGWLLHAADAFLTRRGWNLALEPPLAREQIAVFGERLYGRLNRTPWLACRFARHFDGWLGDSERFQAVTWELAAFEPRAGESDFWPTQFINRLEQEFDHNRQLLRRKIEAATDLRSLFEMLPPV
jgi:hypothetical protein